MAKGGALRPRPSGPSRNTRPRSSVPIRVLTSIVELGLEDARLYRIAAHRLEEAGEIDLAIDLFEKVLRLRPEEPQSLRDLALAYGVRADTARRAGGRATEAAKDDLVHAVRLLYRVVTGAWDGRFPEIEVTALMDLNRLATILEASGERRVIGFVDPRLRKDLPMDVRVVMTWDTDMTDMDLWVTEPTGEKCFFSHPSTAVGGMISRDFTNGCGPEEYLVRNAPSGAYRIEANFYGSRSQALTGPTTVRAVVITDFGRPVERRQSLTLRLTESREVVAVGTVQFGGPGRER